MGVFFSFITIGTPWNTISYGKSSYQDSGQMGIKTTFIEFTIVEMDRSPFHIFFPPWKIPFLCFSTSLLKRYDYDSIF